MNMQNDESHSHPVEKHVTISDRTDQDNKQTCHSFCLWHRDGHAFQLAAVAGQAALADQPVDSGIDAVYMDESHVAAETQNPPHSLIAAELCALRGSVDEQERGHGGIRLTDEASVAF